MKKTILTIFTFLVLTVLVGCVGQEVIVSFEENGGVAISDSTVVQKSTINEPMISRDGYTFLGWYEDEALTTLFDFSTEIVRNITLYAKWDINSYNLTFVFNNNTDDLVINDLYSTIIPFPEVPVKEGYTFSGWYLDLEENTEFTINRMPSSDTTVYAKWVQNEYVVNFYLDSSSTTPTYTEAVLHGESVENVPAIPVVTGKDGAWSESLTNVTSDLDVYLEYETQVFTITFKDYDGNVYNTLDLEYGSNIVPTSTPSRTGYDFIGYYSPVLERNIDLTTYTVTTDLELVDNYQIQSFSVSFFGGELGALLGNVQFIEYGSSAVAPTEGYDKVGYSFTGWDVDFSNITADLTVNALYTINQYTVNFDANGGLFSDDSDIIALTENYNSNITVPEVPTKDGFIFTGWYLDLTYENEVYFGTGIPNPVDGFTVYAKWVELVSTKYTVSGTYYFEQMGISTDELALDGIYTVTDSESYTPFINILYDTDISVVRDIEGYEFYKYVYNGVEYFDESELINITQDETVDVYYRRTILTITFTEYIENQNVSTNYYVYYNSSLVNIPTPTSVSGMTVAWERLNFENVKSSMVITALQYDNSLQTVVFKSNESIIFITTNEPNIYDVIDPHAVVLTIDSPLWDIYQDGYKFLGWYVADTDTLITEAILYFDDALFTSNLTTIEARWEKLDSLNEASDIQINADPVQGNIVIAFDVLPVDINGVDVYPNDFTFILNGVYIQSSDILNDSLMNYMTRENNTFTLSLGSSEAYYDFFKEILFSVDDDYSTLIPGTHTLQIISIGDDVTSISSNPSYTYQYDVESIYEGIPLSSTVNDYYIVEDFGSGTLRYIFYANLTYQFQGMTFTVETGSNHITADGNKLTTTSIPGEFTFTINDGETSHTYNGLVIKDIRQFNVGSSYQSYLTQVDASTEDNIFLADTTDYPYYVGANNAFHVDLLIRDNNGAKISISDVLLTYDFYLNDSVDKLDETSLEDYVSVIGNDLYFTDLAIGNRIRIVVEPKYEATKMDMQALEFNVVINDGYNAFTNAELKALYADLNVNLINIHRDIVASLDSNQVYADGSPKNYFARPTNNYQDYGNVYYRVNGNTDDDQIVIEGNFMTIDGSDLAYINPDLDGFGNIIYAQGFDIVSTQIGIFYYNVYQDTLINNNNFTMNNLRIIGNTTTPSVNYAGTEEEIYNQERLMSQNSGGILGVVVRNGHASINNTVIGYTVIGVTTNAYGETTNGDPLLVDLDYVTIYDSWANSVYLWGGSGVSVDNSDIGSSGGAAIHFEDVHPGTTGYDDPILILGNNNEINNWISGQEAWFKAYAMSSVALALKSNINMAVSPLEKTIIQMVQNPVSGLDTEMINLVFLSLPQDSAVTYSNPNDSTSVITASEVELSMMDSIGLTHLERTWNFTTQTWQIDATTSIIDPRVIDGQYGFALGNLSDTYAFLGMITDIMTLYYQNYGAMMSQADAGNLATIAGFYNLTALEVLQVGGYLGAGLSIHDSVIAVKGSLDYEQPQYIEVVAPIALTGAAGNATVLIEMFNTNN
ncbi:InlB B-repeat-containing protein [Candidatus Izemoplasma sp. B36]|uniref:InlB B-repeat-containing protein n=1 Tax=Candidatus Izemoplasma sp. B36 TaxID=3242468 RepID=UPI003559096B